MKSSLLLLVAICLITVACGKTTIKGELFVVTAGGENKKMGNIQVFAVSAKEIRQQLSQQKSSVSAELDRAGKDYESCISGYATNEKILSSCRDIRDYAAIEAVSKALKAPTAIAAATTNSDGKFEMTVPGSSEVMLQAMGSRSVYGNTELYLWLKPVPSGSGERTVNISNDSLVDFDSAKALIAAY